MEQEPVFPPEVLERILGELPPTKFLEVITEHLGLSELLHMKKKTKLFPLMLRFLFDYLPVKEFIAYRTLNHDIKQSVDVIMQEISLEPSSIFKRSRVSKRTARVQKLDEMYSFTVNRFDWTPSDVQRCLTHFSFTSSPNCNPFLMRTIKLRLDTADQASMTELLSHFGHQLLAIHCAIPFFIPNRANGYVSPSNFLISILPLTPNIKYLTINGELYPALDNDPSSWSPQQLPALPHLEQLKIYTVFASGRPDPNFFRYVAPLLQCYGTQLTSFICSGSQLTTPFLTRKQLRNCLPNLRRLCIFPEDQVGLNKLKYGNWKLEHLQICSRREHDPAFFSVDDIIDNWPIFTFSHLFKVVCNFSDSLIELNIGCRLRVDGGGREKKNIVFSRLKRLTMQLEIYQPEQICEGRLRNFIIGSCFFLQEINFEILTRGPLRLEGGDFLENPFVVIMSRAYFAAINKLEFIVWFDIRADKKRVVRRGMLASKFNNLL